jgi:hypothetical protein
MIKKAAKAHKRTPAKKPSLEQQFGALGLRLTNNVWKLPGVENYENQHPPAWDALLAEYRALKKLCAEFKARNERLERTGKSDSPEHKETMQQINRLDKKIQQVDATLWEAIYNPEVDSGEPTNAMLAHLETYRAMREILASELGTVSRRASYAGKHPRKRKKDALGDEILRHLQQDRGLTAANLFGIFKKRAEEERPEHDMYWTYKSQVLLLHARGEEPMVVDRKLLGARLRYYRHHAK